MIFELFGLPGSGKTRICNEVCEKYKIRNTIKFYRDTFFGNIYFHFIIKILLFNKDLKKKYLEINNILDDCKSYKNCINNDIDIKVYIRYMLFVYKLEKDNKKCNMIIDEGIFHYCIALMAEFNVPMDKIDKILKCLKITNNIKILWLDCNIEQCILQIRTRNRKRSPIDFLNEEKLKEVLNRYYNAIKYFANKSTKITSINYESVFEEILNK